MSSGPGLYEFLIEAELQQYYSGIKNDLKIQNATQLKYVTEEDLYHIGMSKPEVRRLKKYFQKHFPQNYISKLKKKMFSVKREDQLAQLAAAAAEAAAAGADGQGSGGNSRPSRVPSKHIIPADAILVNKELGVGEFGVVQQGVWTNDGERIQVAIKWLSTERMQHNPIEFLKEAVMMHSVEHEHIVRLYGVVLDTNALMLVTELAPLRSLLECLKEPSLRPSFPVLALCNFAVQIADGMHYLEAKRLIHRDLAARNILVFSKNKVKISDFGLSRALGVGKDYYQTNFNVNLKLPIAWCAPECISYLRFTSASDVWAYGVALWEMFSYGFQPWAALTGHQILEAIDEPNFQRLEQPECCPKEYYSLMLKCWQHDPNKRPKFGELVLTLPECKPEQVQAIQDVPEIDSSKHRRDQLIYRTGDIITVLDKGCSSSSSSLSCSSSTSSANSPTYTPRWKGVLPSGKTGFFNPAHTVAYLGTNLPTNKPGNHGNNHGSGLTRGDGRNFYSSKRGSKLRREMISAPQGDVKHTVHVGLDGAYFGDISFLGGKGSPPERVVAPYKPHNDSDGAPLLGNAAAVGVAATATDSGGTPIVGGKMLHSAHEYHEISDNEEDIEETAESPRFEKSFDLGPSLLDEMDAMFRSLGGSPPPPPSPLDEAINVRNEMTELAARAHSNVAAVAAAAAAAAAAAVANNHGGKKKQAIVKPISAADERTLDEAIALANELTAKSMNDLDSATPPESPLTPLTPNKRKFSFRFPPPSGLLSGSGCGSGNSKDRRTFSEEAASIPDIQDSLTESAKEAYNNLVEQSVNPLRMLRSGPFPLVKPRPPRAASSAGVAARTQSLDNPGYPHTNTMPAATPTPSLRKLSQPCDFNSSTENQSEWPSSRSEGDEASSSDADHNPIPLPPRDRSKSVTTMAVKPRHQRKHPLLIPVESGLTRTLARVSPAVAVNSYNLKSTDNQQDTNSFKATNSANDDSFEQEIEHQLNALDELPACTDDPSPSCTVISSSSAPLASHDEDDDDIQVDKSTTNNEIEQNETNPSQSNNQEEHLRIMTNLLKDEVSRSECLEALSICGWSAPRAIKLCRLRLVLHNSISLDQCQTALETCNWEVAKAASWHMTLGTNSEDAAQV